MTDFGTYEKVELLSCGAGSGIMLCIKGAKILGTRSLRQQFCMVAPDEGVWIIDIQKRKIHIMEIVPYMHVWFEPLQRKTLKVFIILHKKVMSVLWFAELKSVGAIHCFRTVNMDVNF